MLETLGLIPQTDLGRHWMQVEGMRGISAPNATPPGCSQKQPTSSTSERPQTIGAGLDCFSSPCARWSTACHQGMPKVLPGHVWGSGDGSIFLTKRSTNSGGHTPYRLSWRSGESTSVCTATQEPLTIMPGGKHALRDTLKACF